MPVCLMLSVLVFLILFRESYFRSLATLPEFFLRKGPINPNNPRDTSFNLAYNTDILYFDWLREHPEIGAAFNSIMKVAKKVRGLDWFEYFPVEKLYSSTPSGTLIVDIGGGVGHDLIGFKARHPAYPGQLLLQDLPEVVNSIDTKELESQGIQKMGYSFFNPQPVEGASCYILKNVLHDWPDAEAKLILQNIASAMSTDSTLLVSETCLPEAAVPLQNAAFDIVMMMLYSALDRTENQWAPLLQSAGFEVVKKWQSPTPAATVVFELVLKQ
jgi:hypothetical protein